MPDPATTLASARARLDDYRDLIRDVTYVNKGVLFSEALFMIAAIGDARPRRIVESGRAMGQSTLLLAKAFPDAEIISVEIDPDSPDVPIANERLAGFDNLELRFADSEVELPRLVRPGDVAVIDGPKGWRSIRLALRLLKDQRPALAFVHDCYQGIARRDFLDRHVPEAFFSDDPEFVDAFSELDAPCWIEGNTWRPYAMKGEKQKSYGPTVACLPLTEGAPYARTLRRLAVAAFKHRLTR